MYSTCTINAGKNKNDAVRSVCAYQPGSLYQHTRIGINEMERDDEYIHESTRTHTHAIRITCTNIRYEYVLCFVFLSIFNNQEHAPLRRHAPPPNVATMARAREGRRRRGHPHRRLLLQRRGGGATGQRKLMYCSRSASPPPPPTP